MTPDDAVTGTSTSAASTPAGTATGAGTTGGPGTDPAGPLTGLRVLVPRAPERAGALVGALRRAGAEPVAAPLVRIGPPEDLTPLDDALGRLATGRYAWLCVTSGFTVDSLEATAARAGRTLADVVVAGRTARPGSTRVAAVGDATAGALRAAGVEADFLPAGEQSARGMLAEWPGTPVGTAAPGTRGNPAAPGTPGPSTGADPDRPAVLVPQGDLAEPTLADGLAALGLDPHVVVSYRNSPAEPLPAELVAELAAGAVGAVVLTSGSTARRLAAQVTLPATTLVCCIGPRTAEVAAELGLPTGLVAAGPHPRAVVDALVAAVTPPGRRPAPGGPTDRPHPTHHPR